MNDPWRLLGLDPQTANEKDIKVAYARLLKSHRPDVDPAGFRRVYDAYQSALAWLNRSSRGNWHDLGADNEDKKKRELPLSEAPPLLSRDEKKKSLPESTANKAPLNPPAPAATAPDTLEPTPKPGPTASKPHTAPNLNDQDAFVRTPVPSPKESPLHGCKSKLIELKRLLHGWHFPWSVRRAFEAVSRAFDVARVSPAQRSREWRAVFDGNPELLARRIPDPLLVSLVHLDEFFLCYDVVSQWHSQGKWKRMKYFGAALINGGSGKISPLAGDFIVFLSKRLAVAEPEIADRLASLAFLLINRAERDEYANTIARDIWLGRQLSRIHGNYRHFWNVNLAHGAAPMEGTTYRLRRIVLDTVGIAPAGWPGWHLVRERMTSEFQVKLDRWTATRKGTLKLDMLHLRDLVERIAISMERIAFSTGRVILAVINVALVIAALSIAFIGLKNFLLGSHHAR